MKTKNLFSVLFGIALLFLAFAPFVQAGDATLDFEANPSVTSMTINFGEIVDLTMDSSSNNNIPVSSEKLEAIQGSSVYPIMNWNEPGMHFGTTYLFFKDYALNSDFLGVGIYTLRFSAQTNTGTEFSELTLEILPVDTNAPVVEITSPQNGQSYSSVTTANFIVHDAEENLDSCSYSLNGAPNLQLYSCSEDVSNLIVGLVTPTGTNTLTVFANDTFGNIGSDTVIFEIDDIAPVITLNTPIIQTILLGTAYTELGATALDNVDGTWNLVSANIDSSNVNTNILGTYEVYYNVQDSVGNSAVEVTRIVNVVDSFDTNAPNIVIVFPVEGTIIYTQTIPLETNASFIVDDPENNLDSCSYSLDGGSILPISCSEGVLNLIALSSLSVGNHNLKVYAKDSFGNEASDLVNFKVEYSISLPDITAPHVIIDSPESITYTSQINSLDFHATDEPDNNLQFYWATNGTDTTLPEPCSGIVCSDTITELSSHEGSNTWTVFASDSAGNVGSASVIFEVNTTGQQPDTTAPIITALDPVDGEELEYCDVTLMVSLNEDGNVSYSLDGGANVTMDQVSSWIFESDELELEDQESYNVTFYATDLAGNTASKTIEFSIDEKDSSSSSSSHTGDSYWSSQFVDQPDSSSETGSTDAQQPINNELTWWEKFINWLCRLFGLEEAY